MDSDATYFWAKTTKDGQPGISVRDHCLSVGCVAEALREHLPESLRVLIPPATLVLVAGHDIGKITVGFLKKCPYWLVTNGLAERAKSGSKSGVAGLIAAAIGLPKGSERERETLAALASLRMTSVLLPRNRRWQKRADYEPRTVRRLTDYHTVGGGYDKATHPLHIPRKAKGGPADNATVTEREFLMDARFAVLLVPREGAVVDLEETRSPTRCLGTRGRNR